jgi:hypothetical protein
MMPSPKTPPMPARAGRAVETRIVIDGLKTPGMKSLSLVKIK